MSKTYTSTSGAASSSVDVSQLLNLADTVSDGAASGFVRVASKILTEVHDQADPLVPVRRGSLKASIEQRVSVNRLGVGVTLGSWEGKAKFVKFSKFTTEALEEEIQRKIARGNTPAAKAKIEAHARKRSKAMHGMGAPSDALAAKAVLVELIRKPATARQKDLAREAQADLLRLAGEVTE